MPCGDRLHQHGLFVCHKAKISPTWTFPLPWGDMPAWTFRLPWGGACPSTMDFLLSTRGRTHGSAIWLAFPISEFICLTTELLGCGMVVRRWLNGSDAVAVDDWRAASSELEVSSNRVSAAQPGTSCAIANLTKELRDSSMVCDMIHSLLKTLMIYGWVHMYKWKRSQKRTIYHHINPQARNNPSVNTL